MKQKRNLDKVPRRALETEKLRHEIRELQRPWWQTPSYLAILLPTALALVTGLYAAMNGYFTELDERIRNEKVLVEILEQNIRMRRDTLQIEYDQLALELQRMKADFNAQITKTSAATDSLKLYTYRLDSMRLINIASLGERNDLALAVRRLQESLNSMRAGVVGLAKQQVSAGRAVGSGLTIIESTYCNFKLELDHADERRLWAYHPSEGERAQAAWDRANDRLDSLLKAHPWLSLSPPACP